jgi:alpha-ketoglutaric semialdehyde dehydrogenase
MTPFNANSSQEEIHYSCSQSVAAFQLYKNTSLQQRHALMHTIANTLQQNQDALIRIATNETHLSVDRLQTEFNRTLFQWRSYADHCLSGNWMNATIDSPTPQGKDIRKIMIPLGPVAVFGASNFPFAYSTAGGDSASALAAGCTVIIKGHPAHPLTSSACADLIRQAIREQGIAEDIFIHLHGESFEVGEALVKHPHVKSVAFTGSMEGGRQLFNWAAARPTPIPVFAEMGSLNPIFILPEIQDSSIEHLASNIYDSILSSMGQFCTKPGLIIGIDSPTFTSFTSALSKLFSKSSTSPLLHVGILNNYNKNLKKVVSSKLVNTLASSQLPIPDNSGIPLLASISAEAFIHAPELQQEVFGPFSLVILCKNNDEMKNIAEALGGQLTATLIGTNEEIKENEELYQLLSSIAGRVIINGIPTGVDVCLSMQHGGPYPASTDSRFTAVGGDAIKRFVRPVCFQNAPDDLLPAALKNENPLGIYRMINNQLTKEPIHTT